MYAVIKYYQLKLFWKEILILCKFEELTSFYSLYKIYHGRIDVNINN